MPAQSQPTFQIRGSGHSFAILHGTQIIGRATSHGNAVACLPGIARRLATKPRPCMGCRASFQSRGPHHAPHLRKGRVMAGHLTPLEVILLSIACTALMALAAVDYMVPSPNFCQPLQETLP